MLLPILNGLPPSDGVWIGGRDGNTIGGIPPTYEDGMFFDQTAAPRFSFSENTVNGDSLVFREICGDSLCCVVAPSRDSIHSTRRGELRRGPRWSQM